MGGRSLARVLEAACRIMTKLLIYPLSFHADPAGAEILTVMPAKALLTRSRGPYRAGETPPEPQSTADWISLRWSMEPEPPEFTAELGPQWPRLVVAMPYSRVLVRFVVPEEAPPIYQPTDDSAAGNLASDTMRGLRYVARSLEESSQRLAGVEPPMTVTLSYADDPRYEADLAKVPPDFRHLLTPMLPVINLDRRRCSPRQRQLHDEALRSAGYESQTFHPLGRRGFTTQHDRARVEDRGDQ